MSGSKRARFPLEFAEGAGSREPSAKALKEDTVAIYEATLNKLKLGARAATGAPCARDGKQQERESGSSNGVAHCCPGQIQGLVRVTAGSPVTTVGLTTPTSSRSTTPQQQGKGDPRPCYVCMSRASHNVCFHCSRGCCEQCSRRCEGCQELFCSICSTSNYNERYDRSFCFDCNTKALFDHSNLSFRSTFSDGSRDMDVL